jgi:hypothetical protein
VHPCGKPRPMMVIHHLALIQARIEKIATQDSAAGTGASLDETLARLTHAARRRVTMLLGRIRAFSDDPQERAAVDVIRRRAARAWYGSSVSFFSPPD